ncbi:MAG: type II secretion system minor pseudopilin GspK [Pseudomarimonas sp.]
MKHITMHGRQSGVALLSALLVVAIAVVLVAALLDMGEASRSRTRNALRAEQTWQLLIGLEGWAAAALARDEAQAAGVDGADDGWLRALPPISVPGGQLTGRMRDRSGCFNLNQLVVDDVVNTIAVSRFQRLLAALKLDPGIADRAVDWIDSDAIPGNGGAEDSLYLQRNPAYLTAGRGFTHVSELRLLAGVDADSYATLATAVCAMPSDGLINLNFASKALWMSLDPRITESVASQLWREGRARYLNPEDVVAALSQLGIEQVNLQGCATFSRYMVAEAEIVSDGIPFAYSSLLERGEAGIRVLARVRGRL